MKIIRYRILNGPPDIVAADVQRFIDGGWQPYGDLISDSCETKTLVIQAVVKYDTGEPV